MVGSPIGLHNLFLKNLTLLNIYLIVIFAIMNIYLYCIQLQNMTHGVHARLIKQKLNFIIG